jgi:phosphoribosylformylglycinamidine synthase
VSLYNQTGEVAILPTPLVGVLGVVDDVRSRLRSGWPVPEYAIVLLGTTRDELDGSAWADAVHGHLGGRPPIPDLDAERRLAELMAELAADRVVGSAHDLSDGGLAQALAECCLLSGLGADVALMPAEDAFVSLFSESAGRVVVSVAEENRAALTAAAARHAVPAARIGRTSPVAELSVHGRLGSAPVDLAVGLGELRETWRAPLAAAFGA